MITKTRNRLKKSLKRIVKIIRRPEMVILPGNISYALILSIFPSIMALTFIISLFNVSPVDVLDFVSMNMPKDIYDLIYNFLDSSKSTGFALLTFLIALFFSSNGTTSIIVAANVLYKTEEKNMFRRTVKSLLLVMLLMFLFAFTMFVLGFGSSILKTFIDRLDGDYSIVYKIFTIIKWPISFILIYFFIKILYVISPSAKLKSKDVTKGALFTTIGWVIATYFYSIYVNEIAAYNVFYGSLSSIIVLMIWIYLLSNILVIGIAINAEDYLSNEG